MKKIIQVALITLGLATGAMAAEMEISSDRIQSEDKNIQGHVIQLPGELGQSATYKLGEQYYTIKLSKDELAIERGQSIDEEGYIEDSDATCIMHNFRNSHDLVKDLFAGIDFDSRTIDFTKWYDECRFGYQARVQERDGVFADLTYGEIVKLFLAVERGLRPTAVF